MQLNLVYNFQSSRNQEGEFRPASYKVIYFFSAEGFMDEKLLKDKAMANPLANSEKLSFQSLDDLKDFALQITKEIGSPEVRLISTQDFNIGLDGARDIESFRQIFNKFGEVIENPDGRKKKGLFGKFFS